tara:strand:+ start:1190 stop:4159 length:2970 start_codon:yes stop_codon:yes gene_type:complete
MDPNNQSQQNPWGDYSQGGVYNVGGQDIAKQSQEIADSWSISPEQSQAIKELTVQLAYDMAPVTGPSRALMYADKAAQRAAQAFKQGKYFEGAGHTAEQYAELLGALPIAGMALGAITDVNRFGKGMYRILNTPQLPMHKPTSITDPALEIRDKSLDEAIDIARTERHIIPDTSKGADGQFIGAPEDMNTRMELNQSRENFDALAEEGLVGWDWGMKAQDDIATNEILRGRTFGYKIDSWGLTPQEQIFIDHEIVLAVDRANKKKLGGRSDWTPLELQAMASLSSKARGLFNKNPEKYNNNLQEAMREAVNPSSSLRSIKRDVVKGWGGSQKVSEKVFNKLQANREIRELVKFMTPEEIAQIRPDNIEVMAETLKGRRHALKPNSSEIMEGFDTGELSKMALAGRVKKGWYKESFGTINKIFGEEDGARFTSLLAALSPQTSVEGNLLNTVSVWKNWIKAGRPKDPDTINKIIGESVTGDKGDASVLNAWRSNALRSLTAEDPRKVQLSGGKVQSFYQNLIGEYDEVTNDTWMGRAFGLFQDAFAGTKRKIKGDKLEIKTPEYILSSASLRKTAKRLKALTGEEWTPAEVQETIWSFTKALYERGGAKGETRTLTQIAKQDDLTKDIADVPDFATLLGGTATNIEDPNLYKNILLDAGYGKEIAGLGSQPNVFQATQGNAPTNRIRGLGKIAKRLEAQYKLENIPLEFNKARKAATNADGSIIDGGGSFTRRSTRVGIGDLGNKFQVDEFSLSQKQQQRFKRLGVSTPKIYEVQGGADEFHRAISNSKLDNPYAAAVYVYDPQEYAGMKLFLTKDGKAGFAIKEDGDIVSVFNSKSSPHKFFAPYALSLAVNKGGIKLDAYDSILPKIYSQAGFKISSRNKWVDEFAPEGWDKETFSQFNNGEPDVVYMYYNPEGVKQKDVLSAGPQIYDPKNKTRNKQLKSTYEEAVKEQNININDPTGSKRKAEKKAMDELSFLDSGQQSRMMGLLA